MWIDQVVPKGWAKRHGARIVFVLAAVIGIAWFWEFPPRELNVFNADLSRLKEASIEVLGGTSERSVFVSDRRFRKLELGNHVSTLRLNKKGHLVNLDRNIAFASAAFLNKHTLVAASYDALWSVDIENGVLAELLPTTERASDLAQFKADYGWVPAGVYWHNQRQRLFVANYLGNNILVFKLNQSGNTVLLESVISTEHTISPENVYVSEDGNYLVAANYDGDGVVAFRRVSYGNKWEEIWFTGIRQAHGVAIIKDRVFATGLVERRLYELDLWTGAILRSIGGLGWNPITPSFLWPTSVLPYGETAILLSDAQTGLLSTLSPTTLEHTSVFGGNGPTLKFLNMPYSAIAGHDKLVILSTFQTRIVVLEPQSLDVIKDFVLPGQDWSYVGELVRNGIVRDDDLHETFRRGYSFDDPYRWQHGPTLSMFGETFKMHFGGLVSQRHFLSMPKFDGILNSRGIYYFLDHSRGGKGEFLFSSSARQLLYLAQFRDAAYAIPYPLSGHPWRVGTSLLLPSGVIPIRNVENRISEIIANLRRSRIQNKIIPWAMLAREIVMPYTESLDLQETREWLVTQLFSLYNASEEGKRFISTYLTCDEVSCDAQRIQQLAIEAFREAKRERVVSLERLILPCMLASLPCDL